MDSYLEQTHSATLKLTNVRLKIMPNALIVTVDGFKTMEVALKSKITATLKVVTCVKLVMLDFLLKVMENAISPFPVVWDTI